MFSCEQKWKNRNQAGTKQGEIQLDDGQTDGRTDTAQVQVLSCTFAAKNFSTLGPKLRGSKAQQDYGDKQCQICIEIIDYLVL